MLQLYNANDPFLFVANMTNGSMVLAKDNINEMALGMVSLLLSVAFCIPLVFLYTIAWAGRNWQRRNPQSPLICAGEVVYQTRARDYVDLLALPEYSDVVAS
jgi:hypothetical protein